MSQFSWGRAFKHAALPVAAVLVAGIALAGAGLAGSPEHAGELAGRGIAAVLPIALLVSYLAQTGRATAAWAVGIGVPVVLAAAAIAGIVHGIAVPALTDAERAPPTRAGNRLHQAAIGYSLPDPGAAYAPFDLGKMRDQYGLDLGHEDILALRDPAGGTIILIGIEKGEGGDEVAFKQFLGHMIHGLQAGDTHAPDETVHWNGERGSATITAQRQGIAFHIASWAFRAKSQVPFIITVTIPGAVPPALAPLLTDLEVD